MIGAAPGHLIVSRRPGNQASKPRKGRIVSETPESGGRRHSEDPAEGVDRDGAATPAGGPDQGSRSHAEEPSEGPDAGDDGARPSAPDAGAGEPEVP